MAENSSSDAQPSSSNENTSSSARGARNNNNNNNNDNNNNNNRNNYSRRQKQQFKGLYDEKFGGLTINNTNLTATHYQKFKAAVLSLVMTETDGRYLYEDINKNVDTWTNKAEPARDDSDKLNSDDIKQHRKKKERYLNNTLTMATMIMAQCDDYVKSLLRSKSGYDLQHT